MEDKNLAEQFAWHDHDGINSIKIKNLSVNGHVSGADVNTILDSTFVKIPFLTIDFTNGINWDTTNKRFVVVTTGQYQVNGQITWDNSVDGKPYHTIIYKNGTLVDDFVLQGGASNAPTAGFIGDIFDLAGGDYIELYGWQNSGGSSSAATGNSQTFLSIALI